MSLEKAKQPLADDKKLKRVEIIMLKYNQPLIEGLAINKLIENTDWPYKLTIFDNRPNPPNMSKVWNKLVREATCEYIVIMDSDIFVTKGWLTNMMAVFEGRPKCMVVVPVMGDTPTSKIQQIPKSDKPPFLGTPDVSGCCFLFKKEVLDKVGWFDEDFYVFGQDAMFFFRVINLGYEIWVQPKAYVEHGIAGEASLSTRQANFNWQEEVRYSKKLYSEKVKREKAMNIPRLIKETGKSPEEIRAYIEQVEKPLADDKQIERVEIIVLVHKSPKNEVECIKNIIEKTKHPYQLTIFDNRPNPPNMSKVWNKLVREATCEYIVIMDSDAFVRTDGWLGKMIEVFKSHPDCGVVVPLCGKNGSCPKFQQGSATDKAPYPCDYYVSGYCFMFKRKLVNEIGWFDENFFVYGQDSDWIDRLKYRNYKPYIQPQVEVTHLGMSETTKASEEGIFDLEIDRVHAKLLFDEKRENRKKQHGLLREDLCQD